MTDIVQNKSDALPLMEAFYTIQGEGANAGKPAYFIRLAGCDVGCVWCDVKDSWDVSKHPLVSIEVIVEQAKSYPSRNVVITGGEPLQHNLNALCEVLHQNGFTIWLETSAAYTLSGKFDWICVSPKKFKAPLNQIIYLADELKVVVFNKSDLKWAEEMAKDVHESCKLFLQPEWEKKEIVLPLIIDYVKQHPRWNISLQTHKYINVP
jgi:organic radical activating enzyme